MVVLAGVTASVPESVFRLLVPTSGEMLTLDAPVRLQDKVLDWPAEMLVGEAEKEMIAGGLITALPPPLPLGGGEVTVTMARAVVVPM